MQGGLDDNVLPALQEKFVASYRAAGGDARSRSSRAASTSGWRSPGPMTDKAHEMVKAFIARALTRLPSRRSCPS